MYKLIRCFAPVVLVLYVSTMLVGGCWGEAKGSDYGLPGEYVSVDNNSVSYSLKFNKPGSNGTTAPMGKVPFEMKITAFYKNEHFKSIRIISSEALEIQKSESNKGGFLPGIFSESHDYTFLMESPTKEGRTYRLTYEGITEKGEIYTFSQKLIVDPYEKPQKDLSVYLVIGSICGAVIGGSVLGDKNGAVGWIIGAPIGGLVGAIVAVTIGQYFGPEPEDQ